MGKPIYTQLFLRDIQKIFPNTCFYRLTGKRGKNVAKAAVYTEEHMIEKYNNDENQNGIYFTPNGDFNLHDTKQRRASNAHNIYAFMVDRDDDIDFKIEYWKSFPLHPSVIIETKRGYHTYWLLKDPLVYQMHKSDWTEVENYLIGKFGGDVKAKDIARLMRLPGTVHWKEGEKGPVTECVFLDTNLKYTLDDFKKLIHSDSKMADLKTFKKEYAKNEDDAEKLFYKIEKDVSVADVLFDLSNGKWECMMSGSIKEDGRTTNGYKYNRENNYVNNFSSGDDNRPNGGPFSVAKTILGSSSEAYKYFRKKYNIGEDNKVVIQDIVTSIDEGGSVIEKNITFGGTKLIFDPEAKAILKEDDRGSMHEVLSGYINPIAYYKKGDNNVYIIEYEKRGGSKGIIFGSKIGSQGDFSKLMSSVGLTFFGTKKDYLSIMESIHSVKKEYIRIDTAGIMSNGLIVNKPGTYVLQDKYFVDIEGFDPVNKHKNEIFSIGEESLSVQDIRDYVESLSKIYSPHIIHTLFASFGVSFMSSIIRDKVGMLPITVMVGLTQSGKTSLRRYFMDAFGIDGCTETQASATEFSIMKRCGHYVPVYICEFENEVLRFDLDSFIKNNFDGTSSTRGTATQEIIQYPFNAPIFIDGESRSMTQSVYTRSIMLFMNPNYRVNTIEAARMLRKPKNINRYFIDNIDKLNNIEEYIDKYEDMLLEETSKIESSEKQRVIKVYALLLAFADCYGFVDIVIGGIIKQLTMQFRMKGDDKLNEDIKKVLNIAMTYKMPLEFFDKHLRIELSIDYLRTDKKKLFDLQSSIQIVNHHFNTNEGSDHLIIPLSHIFKTKTIHPIFNRYLNIMDQMHIDYNTSREALLLYCQNNKYTDYNFYLTLKEQY